jgi:nucleoside-diphosphate-sugar epimerase
MHITILGGGGFLGRRLAQRLTADGALGGRAITGITLFDLAEPAPLPASFPVRTLAGDLGDSTALTAAIPDDTGVIFHLAAVVSAAAEADYDLGIRVNLLGTLALVNRCRELATVPRVVFPSSVASFGGGQDARVRDDERQVPTNSYGAQKAMAELALADASRRGFLDAVCIRLPTVVVRPGRPNKAASSFASAILREPLMGLATDCPVFPDFRLWICSPRSAIAWFLHAATMDTAPLGLERGVNPPGMTASVAEMLDALESVAGGEARGLVRIVPDTVVQDIVRGWPANFVPDRAVALAFAPHEPLDEVIRAFISEDLAATKAERGLG